MYELDERHVHLQIHPGKVGVTLSALVLCTGAGYAATKFLQWFVMPERDFGLYEFFHLGKEANFPTHVSALLLLAASVLLLLIARYEGRKEKASAWPWIGLAVGFVIMSFDEAAQIHEGIIGPLFTSYFGRGEGIWHFGWYVPFIPLVFILGAVYVPFLKRLPLKYTILFVTAAVLFVGGAIGVEMVQSYISFHRIGGGAMALSLLIEELCEMFGVVLFIYALLSYITDRRVQYTFGRKERLGL